ncbi:MAG: nucleotidyl transferase AbiEii/AbiGii toxin family protein [Desulfobacterales bacterium]|nr:nucleotidyl transferase AbiEii/AbiGii toxin family protein [Desulfobacterales bacterium]
MNDAIAKMLEKYACQNADDYIRALREILQEIALLGLWRGKFFDKAAFYGGTALRILHRLPRFSEDLDFTLIEPMPDFDLSGYLAPVQKELAAFGFELRVEVRAKTLDSPVQSAFLKGDTFSQLLVIEVAEPVVQSIHPGRVMKIKIEVDTDPPPDFTTHTRYLLNPIPFAVRAVDLPDLFAGKMHAVLCRRWKRRVKGRDWYDFLWYVSHHPQLHLAHLEQRMRQSGDWKEKAALAEPAFRRRLNEAIDRLDIHQARAEVEPFIRNPDALLVWSQDFFRDVGGRIQTI